MRPILFKFGDIYLHSYGVFLTLGFIVGIYLALRETKRTGIDPDGLLDLCYWILISAIAGSRLFHVFVFNESFFPGPHPVLKIWEGRSVFAASSALSLLFLVFSGNMAKKWKGERAPGFFDIKSSLAAAAVLGLLNAIALNGFSKGSGENLSLAGILMPKYGVIAFVATALALSLTSSSLSRHWMKPDKTRKWLFPLIVFLSLLIGWSNHIAFNYDKYKNDMLLEIFKIWKGGLTFYGGFILAVMTSIIFCRLRGMSFLSTADTTAPSIMIGLAFGRLGCFSAGCCHGLETSLLWGVIFTAKDTLARPTDVPLHPTQLYSSLNAFFIFLALTFLKRKVKWKGGLLWLMILLYAPMRFFIEFFRADPRGFLELGGLKLSESQAFSIPLVVIAAVMFARGALKKTKEA